MFKLSRQLLAILICLAGAPAVADRIDGEELKDPTRPYGISIEVPVVSVNANRFRLQFVRAGDDSAVAVINERRLEIGDTIDGALVKNIERDHVTLDLNGQEIEIRLGNSVSKTRINDL